MALTEKVNTDKSEGTLIKEIQASEKSGKVASTVLKTDERVIARVTDGIYRQPGSALRELISNAYDADASRVVIKTDAPRFERISIEDDGAGMTLEALAHMLYHIGGSAKRNEIGPSLGVTSEGNPLFSPGGRKLIGKIGIGIFSVAQLTHKFQIITKTKGDKYRTIATVALRQYSDTGVADKEFESGKVNIWREKAKDIEAHGTTIILTDIRPQARDTLRSREIWSIIEHNDKNLTNDETQNIDPPKFHIGRVDSSGNLLQKTKGQISNVPWKDNDNPKIAFQKFVQSVWDESKYSNPNPQLDKIFDYYLQMVWQLSLSIPISYVDGNLFDKELSAWSECFLLSNEPKGSAKAIEQSTKLTIRKALVLEEGSEKNKFDVLFDDLLLQRPIKYTNLPTGEHAITHPLIFVGKCKEEFSTSPIELSGGPLKFEAYLFWNSKIFPTEHRGSLIRINGSSGTLFDPSFMRYQVSEQTRLRQITCEIFIQEGFDSALNIDRESFNYAHPHAVYLTRWLHSALRQLASAQKRVAGEIRKNSRAAATNQNLDELQTIALQVWQEETKDIDSRPPTIAIENDRIDIGKESKADIILYRTSFKNSPKSNPRSKPQVSILDEKVKAMVQVLASFGLLEYLSSKKQDRLIKAIYQILETPE